MCVDLMLALHSQEHVHGGGCEGFLLPKPSQRAPTEVISSDKSVCFQILPRYRLSRPLLLRAYKIGIAFLESSTFNPSPSCRLATPWSSPLLPQYTECFAQIAVCPMHRSH
jgi:hypothetical protein